MQNLCIKILKTQANLSPESDRTISYFKLGISLLHFFKILMVKTFLVPKLMLPICGGSALRCMHC